MGPKTGNEGLSQMSMADDDGVYVSQRRRVQRRKKALVAVVGLAAVLGGGAYGVTMWKTAREATIIAGDTGALGPVRTPFSESPSPSPSSRSATPSPSVRSTVARLSGVPQMARPSPTPTPPGQADDAVAAAQVSRLLRAHRETRPGTLVAASQPITVANEAGPDGTTIRVVSARYDVTARGAMLWAADEGLPIANARCTQNLLVNGRAQVRPGMMLCWRASPGRSVVAVATSKYGRPAAALSAAAIERAWSHLG